MSSFNEYENRESRLEKKNQVIEYLLKQEGIGPSISVDSINTPLVEAVKKNNYVAFNLIVDFYGGSIKDQGKQIHDALFVILNKQSERIKKKMENRNNFVGNKDSSVNKEQIIIRELLSLKKLANNLYKKICCLMQS